MSIGVISTATGADLQGTAFDATPEPVNIGESIAFSYTIANIGDAEASASSVQFYLSTNSTISTEDTLLGTQSVAALAAGTSATGSVSYTVPTTLSSGTYTFGMIVDSGSAVTEASEENNSNRGDGLDRDEVVLDPGLPNLIGAGFDATPEPISVDDTMSISYSINNSGLSTAAASTVSFVAASNANSISSGTVLTTASVAEIAAGATVTNSITFTLPTTISNPSTQTIAMILDSGSVVTESSETDNSGRGDGVDYDSVTVNAASSPDFTASLSNLKESTDTESSSNLDEGATATVDYTINNAGTGDATTASLSFYLSTDSTISTSDTLLGTATTSGTSFASGTSKTGTFSFTVPDVDSGSYSVGVIVDPDNSVTESDETNNTASTSAVITALAADLTGASFNATPEPTNVGETISIEYGITNSGNQASTEATVSFVSATNVSSISSGTVLGTATIPAIAAGASTTSTVSFTLPTTISAPSTQTIAMIIDSTSAVSESNESNNSGRGDGVDYDSVTVNAALTPDFSGSLNNLKKSTDSESSSNLDVGGTATVDYTLRNDGTGSSDSVGVSFYLSSDSTITTADTLLGSTTATSFGAGTTQSGTFSFTVPSVESGNYSVGMIIDPDSAITESDETDNTASTSALISSLQPNLIGAGFNATPEPITTGETMSISYSINNSGNTTSLPSTVNFVAATNTSSISSGTVVATASVPAIAADATVTETISFSFPASLTGDFTWLMAMILDTESTNIESSETDNSGRGDLVDYDSVTVNQGTHPDLVATSFSATPTSLDPGASIGVSYTISNSGTAASAASTANFYLSTDSTISTTDTLLGSADIAAITNGSSASGTSSFTVPTTLAAGSYTIGMIVDASGTNLELSETNNLNQGANVDTGTVTITQPDLLGTAFSVTETSVTAGGTANISYTVSNSGTSSAAASTASFYISTDSSVTTADTLLGTASIASIAASSTATGTTSFTIPSTLAAGSYTVGMIQDTGSTVSESNETNNSNQGANADTDTLTVTTEEPDLVATSFGVTETEIVPGSAISISYNIQNSGSSTASASTASFYISTDSTISTTDTLLGTASVPSINSNSSNSGTTSFTVPSTLANGSYTVGMIVDSASTVTESNETNNSNQGANVDTDTLTLSAPDLVGTSFAVTQTAANSGDSINVSYNIQNSGSASAAASTVSFYISSDSTVDTSDTLLGTAAVPTLTSNSSNSGSQIFTIPSTLATGSYTVGMIIDSAGVVSESSETNNSNQGATDTDSLSVTGTTTTLPTLTIADASAIEADSFARAMTFTVTLSAASASDVSVAYATASGTATEATDYAAASGTLTIPAGSTSATFDVSVTGDITIEEDETFTVSLSSPTNAQFADSATTISATGTITENEVSVWSDQAYLDANPDLVTAGLTTTDALSHYANLGFAENRLISFDAAAYLEVNPDVAAAGFTTENAITHYINFGQNEGRPFTADAYLNANPDLVTAGLDAAGAGSHFANFGKNESRSPGFDAAGYSLLNADLSAAGFTVQQYIEHFTNFGSNEGRRVFDPGQYFAANTDVATAGANAYLHYQNIGAAEGRSVSKQNLFNFAETFSGDLSSDRTSPSAFTASNGTNKIIASQSSSDIDYTAITIPTGSQLSSITLDGLTLGVGDGGFFLGVQSGSTFTEDASSPNAANLLGGSVVGTSLIGTDILDDLGSSGTGSGFTGALSAGTYTFWWNQTGLESTASLSFVVEGVG